VDLPLLALFWAHVAFPEFCAFLTQHGCSFLSAFQARPLFNQGPRLAAAGFCAAPIRLSSSDLSHPAPLFKLRAAVATTTCFHSHFVPVGTSFPPAYHRAVASAPVGKFFTATISPTVRASKARTILPLLLKSADVFTVKRLHARQVERLGCRERKNPQAAVGAEPRGFHFRARRSVASRAAAVVTVGRLVNITGH